MKAESFDEDAPEWQVPWDDLDPGIKEVVARAVASGFHPVSSCQGHGGGDAWIVFLVPPNPPGGAEQFMANVETWVFGNQWDAACRISLEWLLTRELHRDRFVRVTWWGGLQHR